MTCASSIFVIANENKPFIFIFTLPREVIQNGVLIFLIIPFSLTRLIIEVQYMNLGRANVLISCTLPIIKDYRKSSIKGLIYFKHVSEGLNREGERIREGGLI